MMEKVRNGRKLYILSWGFLILLTLVVSCGSLLMPHSINPQDKISFLTKMIDGVPKKVTPPYPPSSEYWLGTDQRGFDLLSLLLHGAKYTFGFALGVTIVRFALAVPLGLFAGVTGRGRPFISTMQLVMTAVPALLLVFPSMHGLANAFALNTGVSASDPKMILFEEILFSLLVFVGLFPLVHQFAERAGHYNGQLYVQAARTMGATSPRIVFRHILPLLKLEVFFAFLTEFVQVLFLLGQLAVVNIFVGGGEKYVVLDATPLSPEISFLLTTSGEWGGLIAYSSRYVREYPWLLMFVGLFYTSAMMIVLFFSNQMQKQLAFNSAKVKKPSWRDRPIQIMVGAAVTIGVLLFVWGSNPVSQPVTQPIVTPNQSNEPAPAPEQSPEMKNVATFAKMFVNYLSEGKWSYAQIFLANGYNYGENVDDAKPTPPFDEWVNAFTQQKYAFVGIGNIQDAGNKNYDVEVKVVSPTGQENIWYLGVVNNSTSKTNGTTGMKVTAGKIKTE